ncbi:hypothetical protein [Psychroserpens damuponensis]|uniref:hypothetical protein n=1 Tax=Psychroserpens damuponensis TaxID=943936 RepID=UPI00058EA52D|nr:hypothetical protein [Psychroserpens damuponensis]
MENYEYLYSISSVIYFLAGICVITASIILYSKKRTVATLLILIGSISAFILNTGSIFLGLITGRFDMDTYIQINAIVNIISGLAYALFCIGLLLFVVNDYKKEATITKSLD